MKHAVVTGAGGGIGSEIARRLQKDGYALTLMGRELSSLEKTRQSCKEESACQCIPCDVGKEESVIEAFQKAEQTLGAVEVLVNCAGHAPTMPFHKLTSGDWADVMAVNLNGVFHCTSQVIQGMRKRASGRIINIASTASLTGYAYVSAYCTAKHGVLGLTRALALETAKLNITVNAVCPGFTDTDIIRQGVKNIVLKTGRSEEEALQAFIGSNPQGRLIQPDEVADTVVWLCSESARSITGQAISISGGETV